jgi:uncharacterized protein YbjT (DUF2867 family)
MKTIFMTGGTGYMGRRLTKLLLVRGHRVILLVRPGSETKVPEGAEIVIANPFDAHSFASQIPSDSVFVQLLGVPHPSPSKADQFNRIDLQSVMQSVKAARQVGVSHFVYVSVAQEPTQVMATYQGVREAGETLARQAGLNCTFLRPWYVLGPGHWWPLLLLPLYALAELLPAYRSKARALGLVTLPQMLGALLDAVEAVPQPLRVMEITQIRHPATRVRKQFYFLPVVKPV